jgi:hypothetical protein
MKNKQAITPTIWPIKLPGSERMLTTYLQINKQTKVKDDAYMLHILNLQEVQVMPIQQLQSLPTF